MTFDLKEYKRLQVASADAHYDAGAWEKNGSEEPYGAVADRAEAADIALETYVLAHVAQ